MSKQDKYELIGSIWLIASWFQPDNIKLFFMILVGVLFYILSLIQTLIDGK